MQQSNSSITNADSGEDVIKQHRSIFIINLKEFSDQPVGGLKQIDYEQKNHVSYKKYWQQDEAVEYMMTKERGDTSTLR